jgi:hypothetical protein
MIHMQPLEDFLPNVSHNSAAKEEMVKGFLLITKAALHIQINPKFPKSVFCCKSTMACHPQSKDSSRTSNVLVHDHSPINTRVIHLQGLVNFSSDNITLHMFPSLYLQQGISLL